METMGKEDLTRELYMNMEYAYTKFHEAIAEYVHKAEYNISSITRDLNGKMKNATINMPGGGRILFRTNEWHIILPIKDSPVNLDLLEQWESKEIDDEINYHSNQINALIKRKQELSKK